jgi:phosphoserine phosphatase
MESLRQDELFLWLSSATCEPLVWRGKRIECYQEGQHDVASHRVRIVYEQEQPEHELAQWIAGLECAVAMARLERCAGLCGLELALGSALTAGQFAELCAIDGLEVHLPTQVLPRLDMPGLLVMDMDSTAIQIECIDELAAMAGVGEAVAEVTERAMQGELDFEQSLRQRVAQLAGSDAGIIDTLCENLPLMPGLEAMIAELKSHGWRIVLASGGFTPFVGKLKQQLALDAAYANELVICDGKLVGEVTGRVVDANFKAEVIGLSAEQWQIPAGQRLAIGDGANDIPMVMAADFGIAYHGKPKLAAAADAGIKALDLRVLPYLLQLG